MNLLVSQTLVSAPFTCISLGSGSLLEDQFPPLLPHLNSGLLCDCMAEVTQTGGKKGQYTDHR